VGNGFYNISRERYYKTTIAYGYPKLLCRLVLYYRNRPPQEIVSGPGWKTTPSPITFTSIYGGEDYDANREQAGWDRPGFNDAAWQNALPVQAPAGRLQPESDYPVEVKDTFVTRAVTHPKDSTYVYDFGQNLSGITELQVHGKKGQTLKLWPAELLTDEGLANQRATGRPYYYTYTCKSDAVETWRPRFTYYGFRYVQVDGGAADSTGAGFARVVGLKALHTRNAAPATGSFSCSDSLFNRIYHLIRWAINSNFQSVLTDCPHREKFGWLEQDYLMGNAVQYNYNIHRLYRKLVNDMLDAQTPEGLVPDIAPEYAFFDDNGFGFRDSPEWGSALVQLPWQLYEWYGDTATFANAYPAMQRYEAYLSAKAKDHLLDYGLGDWFDNGPQRPGVAQLTPRSLTATAIWYHDVYLLSRMAALLHRPADEAAYREKADKIRTAFNRRFLNPQTNVYATGSQTSMSMPLCLGLVDTTRRPMVLRQLVDSIRFNGRQLTAGDIGYHYLVQALLEGGHSQLLYEMNNRDDVPGYGYQLKKGATALTESWAALKEVSNNHLMLGHLMDWFYQGVLGIRQAPGSVAFQHLLIQPEMVGSLTHARGSYTSVYGPVQVAWEKQGNRYMRLHVTVPVNCKATIRIPVSKGLMLTEHGQPLAAVKDIRVTSVQEHCTEVETGSGEYDFETRLAGAP
jgi:hypothetical protein